MKSMHKIRWIPSLAVVAAALLAGCVAQARESVDKRADMSPRGRVSIENVAGEVAVEGWDRSEVHLTGELADNVERLVFDSDGRDVHIVVVLKKKNKHGRHWGGQHQSSELQLKVPRESRLSVSTVSADIRVQNHFGTQDLGSVSGEIKAELGTADAEVESVSGSVKLRGRDEDIELHVDTVSGDINVLNFHGDLEAEAVSGDIDIRGARLREGEFESVSGDIELDMVLASNGSLDIETVSGDVALGLEGNVDAEFRIETYSGSIDDFLGHSATKTSRYGPGRELRFSAGDGNAEVSVSTLSGDVENRISDR